MTKAIEKTIALKNKAIDRVLSELVEPLTEVGNPETLIAKPFEQWTPQDIAVLSKIYGVGNDTVLARLIFNKEYQRVKSLEAEETK